MDEIFVISSLKLLVKTFGHSNMATIQDFIKVSKVFKEKKSIRNFKTLGTSIIFSPMFPPYLIFSDKDWYNFSIKQFLKF